jgi:hypothetical protein
VVAFAWNGRSPSLECALMSLVLDKDTDPNSIDFVVTGVYQFRVGVRRSGTTDTLTSADLAFRKDGVSV